ncbi:DNA recombination protein RmuC [Actinomyces minihominis]|uniref:DNA recombination protein RmuC n=1 Tax=Actinomyces minihominis TaxID=2002838 RepID=UPI000C074FCA|nr:DNA recombination protein RmuC [Actinomyces minihominis]
MDTLVVVLLVLVLVTSAVAAVAAGLLLRRSSETAGARGGGYDPAVLFGQVEAVNQQLRVIEATQGSRSVELQQVLESRLSSLASRNSEDAALRMRTESAMREELQRTLGERLTQMENRIAELAKEQNQGLLLMRRDNATEMEKLRANNEASLEKMRVTVDEKLQGTLEKRLGESFKLVSDRLEQVQRGLGEMQNLATDVGGLKRVLSNVKTRGAWGEVQLARQLEDILTVGQYAENVEIRPNSGERVEFAVSLPGRTENTTVYLPIDSKFPQEPYERLLAAQEDGDLGAIAAATKELEKALLFQASQISSKYIAVPHSTDFAIMYLPTEGLFAEAIRMPGFAADLQRDKRIIITGPTTLMSLLNSLQMGFKTLAIEKRSSEVWQVLAAAKAEFVKYGQVWEKLGKQLQTAQNTVEEAGRRTRAVERRLRNVEDLEIEGGASHELVKDSATGLPSLS